MKKLSKSIISLALAGTCLFAAPAIAPAAKAALTAEAAVVTVNAATPAISAKTKKLIVGTTAELHMKNTTQKVTWSSSSKAVATVDSNGVVTAKKKGTATITAKVGKKKYTCKVTVEAPSLSVKSKSLIKGNTVTVKLNGTTQKVTWATDNSAVATVSGGKVTAKGAGTANITATVGGKSYVCKITVQAPYMNHTSLAVTVGKSATLKLEGTTHSVTWATSDKAIATVSGGKVTAKKKGTATITATVDGKKFTCKVTVESPAISLSKKTLEAGQTVALSMKGTTQAVTWATSNSAVATVSANGVVTAVARGTATVSATVGGVKYNCAITVTAPAVVIEVPAEETRFTQVKSNTISSMQFTLNNATKLTKDNICIICTAGKDITVYGVTTTDNKTYKVSTSFFKNNFYTLSVTLPDGRTLMQDFATDFTVPNIKQIKTTRIEDTKAQLEIYDLDEGGTLYFLLSDNEVDASAIKTVGSSVPVKVGYNFIELNGLTKGKAYNLYYVLEGFYGNVTAAQGPVEIVADPDQADCDYCVVYAAEEIQNKFVFKLNKIPSKELTLDDFAIKCPTDTSQLTLSTAQFIPWADGVTYEIIVPSNIMHKDNGYTVHINLGNGEEIKKLFISHFNPPTTSGGTLTRPDENTVKLTVNSDEAGTVYYGVVEWNQAIYDYDSNIPQALDIIDGKVPCKSQELVVGENVILYDLPKTSVTNKTRVWALYVDEAGNYRPGFADHYGNIPSTLEGENVVPEVATTYFEYDGEGVYFELANGVQYITSDDVKFTVVGSGSLPGRLAYSISQYSSDEYYILIMNHTFTPGKYKMTIDAHDLSDNPVKIVKEFTVS